MLGMGSTAELSQPVTLHSGPVIQVADDSGGEIIDYIFNVADYRESRAELHITGRCDSACTLYLSLPRQQLCITADAYFRFHAPVDDQNRPDPDAKDIMMGKYPGWVRQWIAANHGLDQRLITMTSDYARQFLPTCKDTASKA